MAKQEKPSQETTQAIEPQKTEDGRTLYEITDKAPPYVAGRRVRGTPEIALFEHEARAELLAGHIWPKGMPRKERPVKEAGAAGEGGGEAGGEAASSDT